MMMNKINNNKKNVKPFIHVRNILGIQKYMKIIYF